jgi:Tfp pilus assembly protein PilN
VDRRLQVNLLPAAYELRYQRNRQFRGWVAVIVTIVCIQVLACVVLRQMSSQARELQQGLRDAEQQQKLLGEKIQELGLQQVDWERKMKLAEQLNCKHRWSELLSDVTWGLPDTIVLTRLESDPAKCGNAPLQVVKVRTPADKNAPAEPADVANGLVITGVATDHGSVAVFLRNLNAQGRVGRCLLESTMRQPYLTGEGVMFTIKTKW